MISSMKQAQQLQLRNAILANVGGGGGEPRYRALFSSRADAPQNRPVSTRLQAKRPTPRVHARMRTFFLC